jgi:hypothetical protein
MKCPLESRNISSVDIIQTLLSRFIHQTADEAHSITVFPLFTHQK